MSPKKRNYQIFLVMSQLKIEHFLFSGDTRGVFSNLTPCPIIFLLNKLPNHVIQILTSPTWTNWPEPLTRFAKTYAHKTSTKSRIRLTQMDQIQQLQSAIVNHTERVKAMSVRSSHFSCYHRRHSSRNRRSSWYSSKFCVRNTGIYWHHKFGANAKKCTKPYAFVPVKRIFRPMMTTTASGYSKKCDLLYIHDSCHGYEFFVDTGAEISVIPLTAENNFTHRRINSKQRAVQKLIHMVENHSR